MLKRKIDEKLAAWKKKSNKLPLVIKGARQVGKTFSVRAFAKRNYKRFYEINFFEKPSYCEIFNGSLRADDIILKLSIEFKDFEIVPNDTLFFFDEIQFCPNARTALKFLSEKKDFDIIASGSLLGLGYNMEKSIPLGYTETIEMHSLDFEEFLWALDINSNIINKVKDCYNTKTKIDSSLHDRLMDILKTYIVVGGMPAVVESYVSNNNFYSVNSIQRDIVSAYIDDIMKYADGAERMKARSCFLSIPRQLGKDYKKFQYSVVEKGGTCRKFGASLLWLYDAGIVSFCYNLSSLRLPLNGFAIESEFKVYMRDTGLLISMLDDGSAKDILSGNMGIYKGAIYENIVADIFAKNGKKLYYFAPSSTLEIDFVIRFEDRPTPVEVKSADNTKSKSLKTILSSEKYNIDKAIRLSSKNFGEENSIYSIPLYAAFLL